MPRRLGLAPARARGHHRLFVIAVEQIEHALIGGQIRPRPAEAE